MTNINVAVHVQSLAYAERLVPGITDAIIGMTQGLVAVYRAQPAFYVDPDTTMSRLIASLYAAQCEVLHALAYTKSIKPKRVLEAQRFMEIELRYYAIRGDLGMSLVVDSHRDGAIEPQLISSTQ